MANVRDRVASMVKMPRASWALSDGKVAGSAAGVQEKTKAQIREVLQRTIDDPELVKDFGLKMPTPAVAPGAAGPAAPAAPEVDSRDLAVMGCELLSRVSVWAAKRFGGFSERVAPLAAWEPEERAAVIPSGGRVIAKWIPPELGKYADEIELLTKLTALIVAKVQLLNAAAARENATSAASPVVTGAFGA